MNRLVIVGLACLVSGCVSTVAELRQAQPDKVAEFPTPAVELSYCVQQAMESIEPAAYGYQLTSHPNKREFFVTATRTSDGITVRRMAGLELHFVAHDQGTTVEMKQGNIDGGWLAEKTWPLIERCSQPSQPNADTPLQPVSPISSNPIGL